MPPIFSPFNSSSQAPTHRKRVDNAFRYLVQRRQRVILQAGDTQFRVYWGLLSQHSAFFRDLENLPQPPDEPTVEGCPVVVLPDAVQDVKYLLKALYDPFFATKTALPLAAVGALIRLGRKYDFKTLLDSAVARITFENPTTLEEYDALFVNGVHKPTRISRDDEDWFYFDLLAIARENSILSALPIACLHTLNSGIARLVNGIPRADGTLASLLPVDLLRCLVGRERLLCNQFLPGCAMGWLLELQHPECSNPARCMRERKSWHQGLIEMNVVMPFLRFNQELWCRALCATCCQHALESITAGRKKAWEELPAIFDLPPWEQLQNDL
ncbi:hypothetical protein K438DRAFT_1938713 [Mycena galopus ATCC 62051]|nr:hypothetical protein K438DRAFT_1938713 [Mycena galopus ATCC 62051]